MGTALTSEAAGGRKLANSKSSSHLLPTSSVALAVRSDRAFITHSRITWRQKVGATPIEAQKAAGHASLDMTFLSTGSTFAARRAGTQPASIAAAAHSSVSIHSSAMGKSADSGCSNSGAPLPATNSNSRGHILPPRLSPSSTKADSGTCTRPVLIRGEGGTGKELVGQ
jgi:hypothetical protein